jgi:NADH dehydrogenase FAD-containing subunit
MGMGNTAQRRIVILGAGYAGVMSANRLAGKVGSEVDITLVNPIPEFVERIRLHEVAARPGSDSATRWTAAELIHPAVRIQFGTATRIRPDDHEVDYVDPGCGSGQVQTLRYGKLVYAIGSGAAIDSVPGVRQFAHDVSSISGAETLSKALNGLAAGERVLIVGGGSTAIETVTEIAVARPDMMGSTRHPDILGAGNGVVVTGPAGRTLRMACTTAAPQGAHAAATIIANLRREEPKPFALSYLVLAMSLGPRDGLIQLTRSDDSPRGMVFNGRFGAWFNELNNRYARLILAWERRQAGSYHWAKPRPDGTRHTGHTHTQEPHHARS